MIIPVYITGSSGFVGKYFVRQMDHIYTFSKYIKDDKIFINERVVINFAGKAHDLKKFSKPFEYYSVNTELSNKLFDAFLLSDAKIFITLSSVKAVADTVKISLNENYPPNPFTHYGKSKLLAEQYILSKSIPVGKRVYILRPCMIHGPGNKGNLNLLYNIVSNGFPWPLGSFENKRSFCSIDNLCFFINELILNDTVPSGIYNIADDEPIATNELVKLIAESLDKKYHILNIPQSIIKLLSKLGDYLNLPLNSERLNKLTETYIVSNYKIKTAINKSLPFSAHQGLLKTFNSFSTNAK